MIINDKTYYPVPTVSEPSKGGSFVDPVFGTTIQRMTDAKVEVPDTVTSYHLMDSGYAKMQIENCDSTLILIGKMFVVNRDTLELVHILPRNCWDTKDPDQAWSATDPNVIYATYSKQFIRYNISTGERTVLYDFTTHPEIFWNDFQYLSRVFTAEEGQPSRNKQYWVLASNCYNPALGTAAAWYVSHIVVLDKDAGGTDIPEVVNSFSKDDPRFLGFNFISTSPSGTYFMIGAPPCRIYRTSDMALLFTKDDVSSHLDWGVDDTGREVVVYGYHRTSPGEMGTWIGMFDCETGEEFSLCPWGDGEYHINGTGHNGFAVVSSYAMPTPTKWTSGQIVVVELTREYRPAAWWRVAHTHMGERSYGADPFAKMGRDGKRIYFTNAGWDKTYLQNNAKDTYQIFLPDGWQQAMRGEDVVEPLPILEPEHIISALDVSAKFIYPGFVRHDCENADQTMIEVQSSNYPYHRLYNAEIFTWIKNIPASITQDKDPDFRWDKDDPNILYCTNGSRFIRYNASTDEIVTLHDFAVDLPDITPLKVYAKEGANPDVTGRYWAFIAYQTGNPWTAKALLVYDRVDNVVKSIIKPDDPLFRAGGNFINMSPLGNYVTIDSEGSGKYYVYKADFSSRIEIPWNVDVHAFAGLGVDNEGREVAIWPEPHEGAVWVVMADLETGEKFYLAPFSADKKLHSTCGLYAGWAIVSCAEEQEIRAYELTRIGNAKVWKICNTNSVWGSHTDEPFAKINAQGTRIYFRSNGGTPYDQGGIIDTYMVELPENWEEMGLENIPSPNPEPEPEPEPEPSGTMKISIYLSGLGKVTKSPDKALYDAGEVVTLTAVPWTGWRLLKWTGAVESTLNPITLTMDSDKTLTCFFAEGVVVPDPEPEPEPEPEPTEPTLEERVTAIENWIKSFRR